MSISANLIKVKNLRQFKNIAIACFLVIFISANKPLISQNGKIKIITIDAGHGGHDNGCMYGGAREKDVTLSIALKLGEAIEKIMPDVKVIYTRKTDEFIQLHERAGIANRNNADLFISVHCNANKKTEVSGTETFSMGLHKSGGNLDVAKRENDVILLEKDYQEQYEGFDPNSPEAHIYFSFMQSAYLDQSLKLASLVESNFNQSNHGSRGVKQAGFMVLWRSKMPSVLIETGFLSNKSDRGFLTSESGQIKIAQTIANGVKEYKKQVEGSK
jgi:N-acetylmuramoyl-L-alanine amidase